MKLTLSAFKKRVSEGEYETKDCALRAVGRSALSKKDKQAARLYVGRTMKVPMARTRSVRKEAPAKAAPMNFAIGIIKLGSNQAKSDEFLSLLGSASDLGLDLGNLIEAVKEAKAA